MLENIKEKRELQSFCILKFYFHPEKSECFLFVERVLPSHNTGSQHNQSNTMCLKSWKNIQQRGFFWREDSCKRQGLQPKLEFSQYKCFVYTAWKKGLVVKVWLLFCLSDHSGREVWRKQIYNDGRRACAGWSQGLCRAADIQKTKGSWRFCSADLSKCEMKIHSPLPAYVYSKWGCCGNNLTDSWAKKIHSLI